MVVKNIVINGGGHIILNAYGALKYTHNRGLWNHETVNNYFGTSAGAMLALIICLNYTWEDLDNFIINRPWNQVFKFNILNIFEYYTNNGVLDSTFIYDIFTPLLKGKDIEPTITFKDFYELYGKGLYFYATDLNTFDIVEISHETFPNMKLLDGIYASSCLPILCRPLKIENTYLMDGLFCNYPISKCLEKMNSLDETLGIKNDNVYLSSDESYENMTIVGYMSTILNKLIFNYQTRIYPLHKPKYEISIKIYSNDIYQIFSAANNQDERIKMIGEGIKDAEEYMTSIYENHNEQTRLDFQE